MVKVRTRIRIKEVVDSMMEWNENADINEKSG